MPINIRYWRIFALTARNFLNSFYIKIGASKIFLKSTASLKIFKICRVPYLGLNLSTSVELSKINLVTQSR
jgi:hypothetical protein